MDNNQKLIIVDSSEGAGIVVAWNLYGAASYASLRRAFEAAGLDAGRVPSPPSPEACLGRAAESLRRKGVKVSKNPQGAYVVEDQSFGADGLPSYGARLVLSVTDGGELVTRGVNGAEDGQGDALRARATYDAARGEIGSEDCSEWLSRSVRSHDAIPTLRHGGGVYFVPPPRAAAWRAFAAAVSAGSAHTFGELPAMSTAGAVAQIIRDLEADVRSAADKVQADLDAVVSGAERAGGVKALKNREGVIAAMREKIARYSAIFGAPAQAAVDCLSRLNTNLTMSLVYAEAKAEGRDADAPRLLDLSDATPSDAELAIASAESVNVARFAGIAAELSPEAPSVAPVAEVIEAPPVATPAAPSAPAPAVEAPAPVAVVKASTPRDARADLLAAFGSSYSDDDAPVRALDLS